MAAYDTILRALGREYGLQGWGHARRAGYREGQRLPGPDYLYNTPLDAVSPDVAQMLGGYENVVEQRILAGEPALPELFQAPLGAEGLGDLIARFSRVNMDDGARAGLNVLGAGDARPQRLTTVGLSADTPALAGVAGEHMSRSLTAGANSGNLDGLGILLNHTSMKRRDLMDIQDELLRMVGGRDRDMYIEDNLAGKEGEVFEETAELPRDFWAERHGEFNSNSQAMVARAISVGLQDPRRLIIEAPRFTEKLRELWDNIRADGKLWNRYSGLSMVALAAAVSVGGEDGRAA